MTKSRIDLNFDEWNELVFDKYINRSNEEIGLQIRKSLKGFKDGVDFTYVNEKKQILDKPLISPKLLEHFLFGAKTEYGQTMRDSFKEMLAVAKSEEEADSFVPPGFQRCLRCREDKPVSEFPKNAKGANFPRCAPCHKVYNVETVQRSRVRALEKKTNSGDGAPCVLCQTNKAHSGEVCLVCQKRIKDSNSALIEQKRDSRQCIRCGATFPLKCFNKHKQSYERSSLQDGYRNECKSCYNATRPKKSKIQEAESQ